MNKVNSFKVEFDIDTFDFSANSLFVITDEVKSTGGYSLTAKNGIWRNEACIIGINTITPILPQIEILTQSVIIISTEKKENVTFRFAIEI